MFLLNVNYRDRQINKKNPNRSQIYTQYATHLVLISYAVSILKEYIDIK
jgi:hypothetical protein